MTPLEKARLAVKEARLARQHTEGNLALSDAVVNTLEPQPQPQNEVQATKRHALPITPEMIPSPIRAWVTDTCQRIEGPLEYGAVTALCMIGNLIGRRVALHPKQHDFYREYPNLWGGVVGRPSEMKSPIIKEIISPLRKLAHEEKKRHDEEMTEYAVKVEQCKAEASAAKQAIKQASQLQGTEKTAAMKEAQTAMPQAPAKPFQRLYFASDPTIEAVQDYFHENEKTPGLWVMRDELTGFFRSLDKHGRENDRSFYLEGWNGDGDYTVMRVQRGRQLIRHLCLGVFGGTQPGPLKQYVRGALGSGQGADGFLQRFQLLVYPDKSVPYQGIDRTPDKEARDQAHEIIHTLATAVFELWGAENAPGYTMTPSFRFDQEAQAVWNDWLKETMQRAKSGVFTEAMESHLIKYKTLFAGITLIDHLLHIAAGTRAKGRVPKESALLAKEWCRVMETHAMKIYGLFELEEDEKEDLVDRLLEEVRKQLTKAEGHPVKVKIIRASPVGKKFGSTESIRKALAGRVRFGRANDITQIL